MDVMEKPKVAGFVNQGNSRSNRKRIEQEEKELEELLTGKASQEETTDEEPEVEATEEKPLTREEESFKKRYGDLRRHLQQKEAEWETRFKQLESKSPELPAKEEDLEEWVNKHPDVAAIVQALAAKEADKRFQGAENRLRQIDEEREELSRQRAEQVIRKSHSDFDEIKASDAFHDWAEEQPKWVQDAVYENADDPKSVIRVIDLYKVDKGMTKQARKQQDKDAASTIPTKSRTTIEDDEGQAYFSESQVAKMSDKDYEKNQDKIMEAMRTGKFKYDLSGGAR